MWNTCARSICHDLGRLDTKCGVSVIAINFSMNNMYCPF